MYVIRELVRDYRAGMSRTPAALWQAVRVHLRERPPLRDRVEEWILPRLPYRLGRLWIRVFPSRYWDEP